VLLAICITLSVRISTYPEQADYIRCEKHNYVHLHCKTIKTGWGGVRAKKKKKDQLWFYYCLQTMINDIKIKKIAY
jgi:hypothetical protein